MQPRTGHAIACFARGTWHRNGIVALEYEAARIRYDTGELRAIHKALESKYAGTRREAFPSYGMGAAPSAQLTNDSSRAVRTSRNDGTSATRPDDNEVVKSARGPNATIASGAVSTRDATKRPVERRRDDDAARRSDNRARQQERDVREQCGSSNARVAGASKRESRASDQRVAQRASETAPSATRRATNPSPSTRREMRS